MIEGDYCLFICLAGRAAIYKVASHHSSWRIYFSILSFLGRQFPESEQKSRRMLRDAFNIFGNGRWDGDGRRLRLAALNLSEVEKQRRPVVEFCASGFRESRRDADLMCGNSRSPRRTGRRLCLSQGTSRQVSALGLTLACHTHVKSSLVYNDSERDSIHDRIYNFTKQYRSTLISHVFHYFSVRTV